MDRMDNIDDPEYGNIQLEEQEPLLSNQNSNINIDSVIKTSVDNFVKEIINNSIPSNSNSITQMSYEDIETGLANTEYNDVNPFISWEYDNNIPNDDDIETDNMELSDESKYLDDNESEIFHFDKSKINIINNPLLIQNYKKYEPITSSPINNKIHYNRPSLSSSIIKRRKAIFKSLISKSDFSIECPECNINFNSETSFNDHYILRHQNKTYSISSIINNQNNYTCNFCGTNFFDGDDLDDHLEECVSRIDNIQTNNNGRYICPICNNKYMTTHLLGEHFTLTHNNYNELTELDKKNKRGGFPGFDILKTIKMIKYLTIEDTKNIINTNTECHICYHNYSYPQKKIEYNDAEYNEYNSDSELYYKSELNKNNLERQIKLDNLIKRNGCNRKFIKIKRTPNFKELINYHNKINQKTILPCVLICCNTNICKECLKTHITTKNKVICPFCTKDFENDNNSYIKIIDHDNISNSSWKNWWKNHIDILTPNLDCYL